MPEEKKKSTKVVLHKKDMPETIDLPKKSQSAKVWMIVAIVAIIALIGLGGYSYMSMQKLNKQIKDQQVQIDDLNNKKKTLEDAAAAAGKAAADAAAKALTSTTTDSQDITKVATIHYEARVGETVGKTFKLSEPKFSSNKNFAIVYYTPLENGQPSAGGGFAILKKVNGSWTIVAEGQNLTDEVKKDYGIPNDLING